ncbi:MAG: hypothetical protein HY537_11780 [Deltaproteobacteria bacterium]|nr:hypothetical protein [Deltaproteobacteria bacterium]
MKQLSIVLATASFLVFATNALAYGKTPKNDYIGGVESQINNWETKYSKLKSERDALPNTSDRRRKLEHVVSNIESKLKDVRGDLNNLKSSLDTDWSANRKKIDRNLAELQHQYNEALAE